MRTLAIDVGNKHIGLAITDLQETLITPIAKVELPFFNGNKMYQEIQACLKDYWSEIQALVLGDSSSDEFFENNQQIINQQQQTYRLFKARTDWTIYIEPEEYTSIESFKILKNLNMSAKQIEKNIDAYAAAVMLHNHFLNKGKVLAIV